MRRLLAALLVAAAASAAAPALAQEATQGSALENIIEGEIAPERMALAMELVRITGIARTFDELLPNIADTAKNAFIRANPQMQLGIISVVDRIALQMVSRRPELDTYLARIWASGFTDEEMQELIDFYSSETGQEVCRQHAAAARGPNGRRAGVGPVGGRGADATRDRRAAYGDAGGAGGADRGSAAGAGTRARANALIHQTS